MTPVANAVAQVEILASEPGLYEIALDERLNVLRVGRVAVQCVEEVDRYLARLGEIVRTLRLRHGKVRVLADLRHAPVRTQEVAERLRLGNQALYRPGDRVALVVESSLLKMQLRRTLTDNQNIFLSPNAAETWLTAID
ncbi:hypothetical protein [Sphingomonas turrisvirgatae]|uniref:STAS/SEC14 domain-containing protein n=1 Tax=Sphingomonas turrisvirgatae TaxID=1888892 RepID=A0A1E3LXQ1_9SPHN|nr:hypothetical protein [Sphingomonas turrisvirgatae]ODP38494.1 hypothetical protein BFL28_00070 [Sphingomonas turrisvirgatae]